MAEIVVALDHASPRDALRLVDQLAGVRWVKVGPILFVRDGPALLGELTGRGIQVFLDLKWHDIPNSVAEAVRAASEQGVALATVHALGGREMLDAAVQACGAAMRLAAVSVLTSHTARSYSESLGLKNGSDVAEEVSRLARIAVDAGIHGVVVSPLEVGAVRRVVGTHHWIIVPGIRPPGVPTDDQRRTSAPAEAVEAGATHLVVGRPILRAENPRAVYEELCRAAS